MASVPESQLSKQCTTCCLNTCFCGRVHARCQPGVPDYLLFDAASWASHFSQSSLLGGDGRLLPFVISFTEKERKSEKGGAEVVSRPGKARESVVGMHTFNRYSCLRKHSRKIIQVHCAGISEDIYIYYIGVHKRAPEFN